MMRRPPRVTRPDTRFPYTTLFRSYVDDVVDAIVLAAEKDPANGGIFHIVDPDHITQQEYLAHAGKHFGGKPRITRVPQWLFMTLATALKALGKVDRKSTRLNSSH